jgi:sugar lactone lactonase YvrE
MLHARSFTAGRAGWTVVLFLTIGGAAPAQNSYPPASDLPNPYKTAYVWREQAPVGTKWGFTNGVDITPNGKVMVMTDCGPSDCPSEIDPSGNALKRFGAGMFIEPHGVFVDNSGNVWVTDVTAVAREGETKDPSKGYQVFKFSPSGKLLMTLGTPGLKGSGRETFDSPSDVTVAPNGDIFVSDGHGGPNSRIIKFNKEGKFVKTWGKNGSAPGELKNPHALMFDSAGRLFVGDMGNDRLQIFTQDGEFIAEWKQFGRPAGIFIDKDDTMYVADGAAKGIRIGSAKTGKVTAFIPNDGPEGPNRSVEGVVVDHDGNLYTMGSGPKTFKKYVKQ